jgi:hypothetical protein
MSTGTVNAATIKARFHDGRDRGWTTRAGNKGRVTDSLTWADGAIAAYLAADA